MDPIAKAKMVALKGIKRVLTQDPMNVPPGINRYLIQYKATCHHTPLYQVLTFMQIFFFYPFRQQVSLLAQRLASAPGSTDAQAHIGSGSSKVSQFSFYSSWLQVLVSRIIILLLISGWGKQ